MKVCIYGAGAIGGWMGVRLARAGCEVSVVARGETLRAIQDNGLRLAEGDAETAVAVRASDDPRALGPQDLVVVAVKAPALLSVAQAIGPLLTPRTNILAAMNGVPWWFFDGFGGSLDGTRLRTVDADGTIAAAMPARQVIGCVVHASCATTGPGVIRHAFGEGLILGRPSGAEGEEGADVRDLAGLLQRAGFDAKVSPQIQRDVWFKLWGNMTVNPVSAITGATGDMLLADPLVRGFMSRAMLEAREIGARVGLPIEQEPEDRHQVTAKLGAFRTSMLQDVESGRAVELDALVGAVREMGELTDVPTPFIDALFGLARLHARVRGLY
jgi:2-dehydropantoate 2-reductase